ncbi:chromosome partitioning protein [Rothia nasimurium]|uniref:Chromosome partitioning protein n=1 Tax=Rothia nasimurium TaxID=85336 RepID=A0A4Y9F2S8_9MICC|nr:ParA family protein [Rothia nasimurium]MBF0808472.1 ParA family protein [Rothia nasimurium]TFU21964.1 chromosome partitioning protein [Rothia nasimurium]
MIILIAHHKGGVGKSTLAINLASNFQHLKKKVQILEADSSIHTTSRWADDREDSGLEPIITIRKEGRLSATLKDLDTHNDIVIVDTAGKDSPESRSAMISADILIVPTGTSQADLDATLDLATTIETARDYNEDLKALLALTRASTHALSNEVEEARDYLKDFPAEATLADVVIHHRKAYQSTLSEGRSVIEGNDAKAKAEIQILTQEVLALTEGA